MSAAMYGHGFIDAAREVFHLIGRNPVSTIVVGSLGSMVLWFGRILGTVLSTLAVCAPLAPRRLASLT